MSSFVDKRSAIIPVLIGPFPVTFGEPKTTSKETLAAIPRPAFGGVSATNQKLAQMLDARGYLNERIDLSSESKERSLSHHLLRLGRAISGVCKVLLARGRRSYEMSLDGGGGLIYNIMLTSAVRLRGAPLLLYHHSTSYVLSDSRLMKLLIFVAGSKPTHIACSRRMFELYRARYGVPDKLVVLSNAAWISPSPLPQAPPDPQTITLGYLGALTEEKGAVRAIEAFLAVRNKGVRARLVLAGGGLTAAVQDAIDRAQQDFAGDVVFLGSIPDSEKWTLFASLDYFLFPTLYPHETQSSVAPEAMSAGVPVIAYDHRFVGELIGADGGLLVPPGENFAAKAADWIAEGSDIATRQKRRDRTVAHYRELYATASLQLEDFISRLVKPR